MNAEALGFGLNEVAFTFNLKEGDVVDVGEAGVVMVDPSVGLAVDESPAEVPFAEKDDSVRLPLNGGIF